MDLYTFIRSYMTVSWISKVIERMPKRKSVIYDTVFKNRNNNPSAFVRMDEVLQTVGSVPVVSRDGVSLNVSGGSRSVALIEPMPIRLNHFFSAARLNDLRALYGTGDARGKRLVEAEVDRITMKLMGDTQKTRDALCAQALTGKIDYQMSDIGSFVRYEVNYGTTLTYTASKKWDAADATVAHVLKHLIEMRKKLHEEGHAGNVQFMAASDAWVALAGLVTSLPNDQRMGATVDNEVINLSGFQIILNDGSYSDRNSSGVPVVTPEIEAKKVVAWVEGLPQLEYCAVDDIDGNLEAVPFFAKPVKIDDPSGIRLISESKPLPLVAPKAVLWATVMT